LDHLVVAADTLEQGAAYIQARLGVSSAGGGRHVLLGTHNRVWKLGPDRYLEVIAIDPMGWRPDFSRWFNLDDPNQQALLKIRPRLITWVVRTDSVDTLAATLYQQPVFVRSMQRDSLRWRFAFTQDGSMPADGLIPHLIQWTGDSHPAESMVDAGCTLVGLEGVHVDPESVHRVVSSMSLDHTITIHPASQQRPVGLFARIMTPDGMVVLD
jgi:hypothetical protein